LRGEEASDFEFESIFQSLCRSNFLNGTEITACNTACKILKNENKKDNLFILINVINVFEQHSRDFSRWSDISNANAGDTVAFKSYNLKST